MIEAIRKIGASIQKEGQNIIDIFIDPIGNQYKHVLVVVLRKYGDDYKFDRVELQEFSKAKTNKYLYKWGSSRGTDITPTSKIVKIDQTFKNRFVRWFRNYNEYEIGEKGQRYIRKMGEAIEISEDKVLSQLKEHLDALGKKGRVIITLGVAKNGDLLYVGDFKIFRDILTQRGRKRYYEQESKGISLGRNETCFICKQEKAEVYGFAIPYKFHTFDKPGFIAGGFDVKHSWKNTPVCLNCAIGLEVGSKYVEGKLSFNFYGFRYIFIPKLILGEEYSNILGILENYKRSVKLNPDVRKQITSDENEILELVGEQGNFFNNNFLFYKKEQGADRILLYIEGILPSRLRKLFEVKQRVDEIFKPYSQHLLSEKQKEKLKLQFNFGILRNFFQKESKEIRKDFGKEKFLAMVNKIFVGSYIEYNLIIKAIMDQVRKSFVASKPTNFAALSGFLLLHYIEELDLLRNLKRGEEEMKENKLFGIEKPESVSLEGRVGSFFDKHSPFFDSAAKKAVFLEGVLTQFLLNIQYEDKGDTPFRSKLQGLKLNEKLVKKLLPEMQNKLEEYGKNYYRRLEALIAEYFVLTKGGWDMTDDEVSFYFVLGMNMSKLFKTSKEKEGKDE